MSKGHFINGVLVNGESNVKIDVINPATEEIIHTILEASIEQVDYAVISANHQLKNGEWSQLTPRERELRMLKYADLIDSKKEELGKELVAEHGRVLADAIREIGNAANCFRYFGGWATKIKGETLDVSLTGSNHHAYVKNEPIGVVAAIAPWNVPVQMFGWKVAPALACGCTVVFKPSEITPLTTLKVAALSLEAGIPPGVINVVNGYGQSIGNQLVNHPKTHKITFTGSSAVGKIIGSNAIRHLKEVTLELGGKNPVLVLDDADTNKVPKGAAKGIFYNQGQICVSGSRIFLPKHKFDNYVADLCMIAAKMKVKNGLENDADMGPVISKNHLHKVMNYINSGKESDCELVVGGNQLYDQGYFIEPTIFANPGNHKMPISEEEIFGPVLVAMSYENEEELIKMANDTPYGLSASIWTQNIGKAYHMIDQIDAGNVYVNSPVRSDLNLPLGGFKQSGVGRELGYASIDAYTRKKSVVIAY